MALLFSRAHTDTGVLYYESHEASRLHCLSSKAPHTAEQHGRCSPTRVHALPGAGAATTCVGGDRSRRQRQVAVGGGGSEIVKGFPTLVLSGGDTISADFISRSFSLPLGSRDPWVRHKGGA